MSGGGWWFMDAVLAKDEWPLRRLEAHALNAHPEGCQQREAVLAGAGLDPAQPKPSPSFARAAPMLRRRPFAFTAGIARNVIANCIPAAKRV